MTPVASARSASGIILKKLLLAAAALLAATSMPAITAHAAEQAHNWAGAYAGLNAGLSVAPGDSVHYSQFYNSPLVPLSPSSLLIGGQVGHNWQSGNTVFGIEADIQYRNANDRSRFVFPITPGIPPQQPFGAIKGDTAQFSSEQSWFGTLRGRVGLTTGPVLYYATGGLAYGEVKHFYSETLSPPYDSGHRSISGSRTKVGWVVGAGAEMKLWANWSAGMDYLYIDLGKTTLNMPSQDVSTLHGNIFFPASSASFDNTSHIFRIKLNYALNGMN